MKGLRHPPRAYSEAYSALRKVHRPNFPLEPAPALLEHPLLKTYRKRQGNVVPNIVVNLANY